MPKGQTKLASNNKPKVSTAEKQKRKKEKNAPTTAVLPNKK